MKRRRWCAGVPNAVQMPDLQLGVSALRRVEGSDVEVKERGKKLGGLDDAETISTDTDEEVSDKVNEDVEGSRSVQGSDIEVEECSKEMEGVGRRGQRGRCYRHFVVGERVSLLHPGSRAPGPRKKCFSSEGR